MVPQKLNTPESKLRAYQALKTKLAAVLKYEEPSNTVGLPTPAYAAARKKALDSIPELRRKHNALKAAGQNVSPLAGLWRRIYAISDRLKSV